MNKRNDGGPAFPSGDAAPTEYEWDRGMSLRDYFAAAALTGLLSNSEFTESLTAHISDQPSELRVIITEGAYAYADTMLAERDK